MLKRIINLIITMLVSGNYLTITVLCAITLGLIIYFTVKSFKKNRDKIVIKKKK